ncbi:MAG TPA: DUF5691 domain-containing protein, partial [Longimicrobium sp.]|nr:DUF5691 domain-containing protein [Longimicrobium sp.]
AAAPPELLPALLERGTKDGEVRDGVLAVLGARGRWLAAFEPAWGWAASGTSGDEAAAWAEGSAEERAALLRRVRRADPARGLELVRSTWEADHPRVRAALLLELAAGLSDADEPFLEAALDDRRKEVRAAAAEVLAGLPTSRRAARATERARGWVRLSAPSGGLLAKVTGAKAKLAVEPPKACTPEMERDGVEPKPRRKGGQRAWWLEQVVAAVPPAVWTAEAPPETWIAAARAGDWADALLAGWAAAAARHRDPAWAEALVRLGAAGTYQAALFRTLAPDVYRALARSRVERQRTLHGDEESVLFVARSPYPLGAELTAAVLARVSPKALENDWAMRDRLRLLAARLDPAAALDVVTAWEPAPRGAWVDLLHARHALHEAFAS